MDGRLTQVATRYYDRSLLRSGNTLAGPAIVEEGRRRKSQAFVGIMSCDRLALINWIHAGSYFSATIQGLGQHRPLTMSKLVLGITID